MHCLLTVTSGFHHKLPAHRLCISVSFWHIIEILYDKTKNNFEDKRIVFSQFEKLYLANICKSNINIRETALNICELFLKSEFISIDDKNKIKKYLERIQN